MKPEMVVLLGAQQINPTVGSRVTTLGIAGKLAIITAGWQEREPEDAELRAHLGGRVVNLRLHARGEDVFKHDRELASAHRARQDALRIMQDLYRLRLERAVDAERAVRAAHVPEAFREEARLACVQSLRELDAWHLSVCARIRAEYDAEAAPSARMGLHLEELVATLEDCEAVAIAGGHVAVLVNRLFMFNLSALIGRRPVFAWSGGAMALTERVVLFHDSPPQGENDCEVLDHGLGLVPDLVVFPEPERRLHLDRHEHLNLMSERFQPARCLALPGGASVVWRDGRLQEPNGVVPLGPAGALTETLDPRDGHAPPPDGARVA